MHHWNTRHEQQMSRRWVLAPSARRGCIQPIINSLPRLRADDLALGSLASHVQGQQCQAAYLSAQAKSLLRLDRQRVDLVAGNLQLVERKIFSRSRKYSSENITLLELRFIRSPTVEDIVIVPHHDARHLSKNAC